MSEIAAFVYETSEAAHAALSALKGQQAAEALAIVDAVVAIKGSDGAVHLEQTVEKGKAGAGSGAFWGSLLDLLLMAPVAGATLGAATGAISGYGSDFGINDEFALKLAENFRAGHAAVLVMIDDGQADRLADIFSAHGGTLLYSTLSDAADARLRVALPPRDQ